MYASKFFRVISDVEGLIRRFDAVRAVIVVDVADLTVVRPSVAAVQFADVVVGSSFVGSSVDAAQVVAVVIF